jgi:lipoprotein-anchoring transpeptidase ErfK/SrfK
MMDDIFRRRRRNRYLLPGIILGVVVVGVLVVYYSMRQTAPALPDAPDLATTLSAQTTSTPSTQVAALPAALAPATAPVSTPAVAPAAPVVQSPAAAIPRTPVITAASRPVSSTQVAALSTTAPTSLPSFTPGTVMAQAEQMMASNDLLAARTALNSAIISGALAAGQQQQAMRLQAQINHTLVFSSRRLPGDPWVDSYTVKPGDMLQKICPPYNMTARFAQRINSIPDARKLRANSTIKMVKGPFHGVVTKSAFTMDIYLGAPGGEGSLYVCTYPVGLGQDDSTPAGKWIVEPGKKLTKPKYYDPRGGGVTIEAGDPANPLGDYWIGLAGMDGAAVGRLSYGIHGTIEPDSIGKMASLGCIRMHNEDAAVVYEMLIEGKSIVIVAP